MVDSDRDLVQRYQEVFLKNADPKRGEEMAAYMRDQFPFVGLSSPVRKQLQREILREGPAVQDPFSVALELWQLNEREFQSAGCDLLRSLYSKKKLPDYSGTEALGYLERLVTTKSWWDTIDALAPVVLYNIVTRCDDVSMRNVCREWIRSDNFWIQRSALLCQLKAKENTDEELLFELVLHVAGEKEFFLRKGAGWALREYSKISPKAVRAFIDKHSDVLSPLTIKEGGKYC